MQLMNQLRSALLYPLPMLRFAFVSLGTFTTIVAISLGVSWFFAREERATGVTGPEVFIWENDSPDFGGLSALILRDDALLAATDRGYFVEATIKRDTNGKITAVEKTKLTQASLQSGLPPTNFKMDIEGLSPLPDGRIATAHEGFVRIETLPSVQGRPSGTHPWDRYANIFGNRAFEALATLPDGQLLAITEPHIAPGVAGTQLYNGRWSKGPDLPVVKDFQVTGADVGPDGCLYLVERRFSIFQGFSFRLRRLSHDDTGWQDEVFYAAPNATLGNAEGISVWQSDNQMVLSVITDDGFIPFQPTRLMEFRVPLGACVLAF